MSKFNSLNLPLFGVPGSSEEKLTPRFDDFPSRILFLYSQAFPAVVVWCLADGCLRDTGATLSWPPIECALPRPEIINMSGLNRGTGYETNGLD